MTELTLTRLARLWRCERIQDAMGDGVGGGMGGGGATGNRERVREVTGCDREGGWHRKPGLSEVTSVGAGGSLVGSAGGDTLGSG